MLIASCNLRPSDLLSKVSLPLNQRCTLILNPLVVGSNSSGCSLTSLSVKKDLDRVLVGVIRTSSRGTACHIGYVHDDDDGRHERRMSLRKYEASKVFGRGHS
ncbi:hypothetical protein QCA50_018098 [Cerrena zonata]|uniref:Uncharacterized protein n=1 Tax=Cerrena zonata TaxID=2478898 RepID=A0AAW0FDV5_9APHY